MQIVTLAFVSSVALWLLLVTVIHNAESIEIAKEVMILQSASSIPLGSNNFGELYSQDLNTKSHFLPLEIVFDEPKDFNNMIEEEINDLKLFLVSKKMILLRFPHQNMSSSELVQLSKRLSSSPDSPDSLAVHIDSKSRMDEHPEITIISNIANKNGKAIGLNGSNVEVYHSDLSWSTTPGIVTLLHGVVVPPDSANCGQTIFIDSEDAYDLLPLFVKKTLNSSVGKFCYLKTRENRARLTKLESQEAKNCAEHPIFSIHPITNRRNIFANPNDTTEILGMSYDESAFWLDYLFKHIEQNQKYIHRWKDNSALIWDNRSLQHKANGCSPQFPRLFYRTVTLS